MERASGSVLFNPTVKIAGLWKRSQGLSWIGSKNYKHRVFILTEQVLSYYSGTVDRIGQMKRRIPIESIRAVEFVSESAFNLAHMLQIVYVCKKHGFVTLYVIARDKAECADWVSSIRNACYFNQDMLMHYHPGILIKSKWNCCQQSGKNALGCQPSYHLLTRSSSRYAQMRRKDTLYSVSSKRSSSHQVEGMRRSTVCAERPESDRMTRMIAVSNSCVNLTSCTPNTIHSLTLDEPNAVVGVETVSASPQTPNGACSLSSSHSHENIHVIEGAICLSPSHNHENSHSDKVHQTISSAAVKEHTNNVTHFILGHTSGVRQRSSEPLAHSFHSSSDAGFKRIDSLGPLLWGTCIHKRKADHLSRSCSTLSKPVIEPKISNSDPTVFHV